MAEFRSESPTQAPARPAQRYYTDCREMPSASHCSLVIAGTEDEVMRAAYEHALSVHGETPGDALKAAIRKAMHQVPAGDRTLA